MDVPTILGIFMSVIESHGGISENKRRNRVTPTEMPAFFFARACISAWKRAIITTNIESNSKLVGSETMAYIHRSIEERLTKAAETYKAVLVTGLKNYFSLKNNKRRMPSSHSPFILFSTNSLSLLYQIA